MTTNQAVEKWNEGFRKTSRALVRKVGQIAWSPGVRQLRDLTVRHPGQTVIVVGTVGWLLGLIGTRSQPEPMKPPVTVAPAVPLVERVNVPPEFVVLAGHIADGWRTGRAGPEVAHGEAETIAELRNAALDLRPLKPADPDIAAVVAETRIVWDEIATSMERFLSLPRTPGTLDVVTESFLRGILLDLPGAKRQHDQMVGVRDDLMAEFRRMVGLLRRNEATKLMLPRLAARHAGPVRESGPALAVDLDEAWGPFGPADWLTLFNTSGADLHNATVLVQVHGEAAPIAPSVHFVPLWPAGSTIQARYTVGNAMLDFAANRQTVPNVASIVVSLWSEEMVQKDIPYTYIGAEHDADIARYCSKMSIRAHYRPLEPGTFWDRQRGLALWLDGVAMLPNSHVTATFRRGTDKRAWSWDFSRWDRGECKALEPGKALPWDPEEIAVEVSFPGTGFKHTTSWPAR